MKKVALLAMGALLAVSFGPVHSSYAQTHKVVRITLIDENGSGEDGSAQITDLGDGTTKVELIMLNAPDGAVQPAHIHKGSCANLDPNPTYPLENVTNGKSTTTVKVSLADLTKERYAINVHESAANVARYVSCGNLPSAASMSGGTMTVEQSMSTLLDHAGELLGTIQKKESDASKNAYDAFHATFAAHENDIKAKNAGAQSSIEAAMNDVNTELGNGDWAGATTAAEKLVVAVKSAQGMVASSTTTTGSTTATANMVAEKDALTKMQGPAGDLVRETKNADKAGAQSAYNEFHDTFAANEDALKAADPNAQAHIETAMHEVRDALAAGDMTKAASSANEIQDEIKNTMSGAGDSGDAMPGTGAGDAPMQMLGLVAAGLALAAGGLSLKRRGAR